MTEKNYTVKCNISEDTQSPIEQQLEKRFERMVEEKVSQLRQIGKKTYQNWLFKVIIEDE